MGWRDGSVDKSACYTDMRTCQIPGPTEKDGCGHVPFCDPSTVGVEMGWLGLAGSRLSSRFRGTLSQKRTQVRATEHNT